MAGLEDTAPTRNKSAQAAGVARTSPAGEAANAVLFSVLDDAARTASDPTVRQAALGHLQNMRNAGTVVFPEDAGPAPAAPAAQAPVAQHAVAPAVSDAVGAAQETVYNLLTDTGLVERTPTGQVAPAAPETQVEAEAAAPPLPQFDFTAPEDLADELDVDFSEDEPLAVAPVEEEIDEMELDPLVAEERRKRLAAEKKAAHYENLRAQDGRKAWKTEVKQHLGVTITDAQLDSIKATSRKGFWREAKQIHAQNVALVKPLVEQVLGTAGAAADEARATARAEAEAAWGKPTVNAPGLTGGQVPQAAAQRQELERLRRGSSFTSYFRQWVKSEGGV